MRYRRDFDGHCWFFTVVTHQRRPVFADIAAVDRLRAAFLSLRSRAPFEVIGCVVLPDHLHCVWTLPHGDSDFPSRWARIKRHVSIGIDRHGENPGSSRERRRERAVFQRRFWEHRIRGEDDLARHLDYIHYNPVRHGLVASPWAWPHSSLRACARRGWYAPGWGENPADVGVPPVQVGE